MSEETPTSPAGAQSQWSDHLIVLVNMDDNVLKLDPSSIKNLIAGNIEKNIKFQPPYQNKTFGIIPTSTYRSVIHKSEFDLNLLGLVDINGKDDKDHRSLRSWKFENRRLTTTSSSDNREEGVVEEDHDHDQELYLQVNLSVNEPGTHLLVTNPKGEYRKTLENKHMKENKNGILFKINTDGSISPVAMMGNDTTTNDAGKTTLYLGVKDRSKMSMNEKMKFSSTRNLVTLQNDATTDNDLLGQQEIANVLAEHVASNSLESPFALGIFGEWGAGKTTFFELMKARLVEIQKESVPTHHLQQQYMGHLYLIRFNAWTFHKDNLWASLMYRIFHDLNDQMEIEGLFKYSRDGGISPIEASEELTSNEFEYLKELPEALRDEFKNRAGKNGNATKAFAQVFQHQYKDDKKGLKRAKETKKKLESMIEERKSNLKKELIASKKKEFWRETISKASMVGASYVLKEKGLDVIIKEMFTNDSSELNNFVKQFRKDLNKVSEVISSVNESGMIAFQALEKLFSLKDKAPELFLRDVKEQFVFKGTLKGLLSSKNPVIRGTVETHFQNSTVLNDVITTSIQDIPENLHDCMEDKQRVGEILDKIFFTDEILEIGETIEREFRNDVNKIFHTKEGDSNLYYALEKYLERNVLDDILNKSTVPLPELFQDRNNITKIVSMILDDESYNQIRTEIEKVFQKITLKDLLKHDENQKLGIRLALEQYLQSTSIIRFAVHEREEMTPKFLTELVDKNEISRSLDVIFLKNDASSLADISSVIEDLFLSNGWALEDFVQAVKAGGSEVLNELLKNHISIKEHSKLLNLLTESTQSEKNRNFESESWWKKISEETIVDAWAKSHHTPYQLFQMKIGLFRQIWLLLFKGTEQGGMMTLLFVIGVIITVAVIIWTLYHLKVIPSISAFFSTAATFAMGVAATVNNYIKKAKEFITNYSKPIVENLRSIEEEVNSDVEAVAIEDQEFDRLQQNVSKTSKDIKQIEDRLKVLVGDSVQDVVKNRIKSKKYLDSLGIVHTVKKDLEDLQKAMFNKYHDELNELGVQTDSNKKKSFPRGKPRILLFIDDLDRCDPPKVVEVLEALQLLVNYKLFVSVACIDAQYVCLSLENKKYREILNSHRCPTGMDFLEKIFQIAYRVPTPVSKDNMQHYVSQNIGQLYLIDKDKQHEGQLHLKHGGEVCDNGHKYLAYCIQKGIERKILRTKDIELVNEACGLFKLTPRSMKRIFNVFQLMRQIWFRQNHHVDDTLLRHNIIFLVMAASSETKMGMMKIFVLMEKSHVDGLLNKENDISLEDLVQEHCFGRKTSDEWLKDFEVYKFNTNDQWRAISRKFLMARSFSFFRTHREMEEKSSMLV